MDADARFSNFPVYPYPTTTPIYDPPPPEYIPFVNQEGDTLNMSSDLQGTGIERAMERGYQTRMERFQSGGKVSYLDQLDILTQ